MLLANPDLPASPTTFNDADIEAFETKYSLDIAPLFAKYCTEFNLEIGNKKRKDNPNITPAMVHPSAPGFAVIWNLLHSIATSHIDLPEVHALRSAIVKPDQPAPSALTQAIENLVCTPRTQRRSTEDVITDVCDRLKLWRASLPTHSDAVNDNLLVTLNYAAYFLGKLVKNSFHTTLKEDRDRLEAQSLVVVLGQLKRAVRGSSQRIKTLDTLYSQARSAAHKVVNNYCTDASAIITALSTGALAVPQVDDDPSVAILKLVELLVHSGPVHTVSTTPMAVVHPPDATPVPPLPGVAGCDPHPTEGLAHVDLDSGLNSSPATASSVPAAPVTDAAPRVGSNEIEMTTSVRIIPILNLAIPSLPVLTPLLGATSYATATRMHGAPLPPPTTALRAMDTWHSPSAAEQNLAKALRDTLRLQPDDYYVTRAACVELQPPSDPSKDVDTQSYIDAASAGDSYVGTALYGIIHRFGVDTGKANRSRLDDDVMANLRYIVQQAGTPADHASPSAVDNGIQIDEAWMQTYNSQLAVTRDCSEDWPYNDGIVFKTMQPIVCGATCILNNQGFPAIFGMTQRILGSVLGTSGRPKAYILQWLPHPVAVEKILDPYKWPNLAVVRGLSQGFEDHAITSTTILAVQAYLVKIECPPQYFTLVLGSYWFDDPSARKTAPTAAALARLESNPRSKAKALQLQGNRVPELVLRIVFTDTAEDCPCGSDDELFKALRHMFHKIDVNTGPVHLRLCGFRLEVMSSAAACYAHVRHDTETSKPTNATVISGIVQSALAADLLTLLFNAGKAEQDIEKPLLCQLTEIDCVVMVPPQVGKQGFLNGGKVVVVWKGPHRYVPMHLLLPLKAPRGGNIGTQEVTLPGLSTFRKAGLLADTDPLDIGELYPPTARDPDDIFAADATADVPPATPTNSTRGGRGGPTRVPGAWRGGRGGRGGRVSTRMGTIDTYRAAFVPSSTPSTNTPQFIRPASAGPQRSLAIPTSNVPQEAPPILQLSVSTHAQPGISSPTATSSAMDTVQTDDTNSVAIVSRPTLPAPASSVILTPDPAVQAILDMMSAQHSQMSATLLAMGRRSDEQALTAARHTEVLIDRAALLALGRDIKADQDQVAREITQITNQLQGTEIPPWFRTIQVDQLASLQTRSVELANRNTELEQRYHLLAAPNESVVARPAQW